MKAHLEALYGNSTHKVSMPDKSADQVLSPLAALGLIKMSMSSTDLGLVITVSKKYIYLKQKLGSHGFFSPGHIV
jgi:hypothetical protein